MSHESLINKCLKCNKNVINTYFILLLNMKNLSAIKVYFILAHATRNKGFSSNIYFLIMELL